MSHALTVADLAPAIVALGAGIMGSVAVWHATRGTRKLRRQRREAAARGETGGDAALAAGDLARARALADALVRVLRAAERQPPDARAAE
jgi:hypothetical protein